MALKPGTVLGSYEVIAKIGAGGMGEVYRARDTKLGREVALKVLPAEVRDDPRRLARLEEEARLLASVNHPHIATIHGLEESKQGIRFLVMELVEGQTLAERIAGRPLPLTDLYAWGGQIAAALAAAHRRGIVHRDLKPANVMLTRSGVKLLDFGLAKPATRLIDADGVTLTQRDDITAPGAIVGTLRYMAPEQLAGRDADERSDIFALGAVLYEMATGRQAFASDSSAQSIAAIVSSEPAPLQQFQPQAHAAFQRAVNRCLAKEPEERWQSAHDLMLELNWIASVGPSTEEPAAGPAVSAGGRFGWGIGVVGLAALLVAAAIGWNSEAPERRSASFLFTLPEKHTTGFARVSPDGRYLSATVESSGRSRLWVRPLDSLEGRLVPGTEGHRYHFWSPDSRSIAFIANGELKRVDLDGGPPKTICEAPGAGPFRLGAWGADGTILFRIDEAPGLDGLYRVPAGGGTPAPLTTVDQDGKELLVSFPSFLPDGRHFLAMCAERIEEFDFDAVGICAIALDTGQARLILPEASYAEYAPPGYLVHAAAGVLMAQPFDLEKLSVHGEPTRVAEGLDHWDGIGLPSFSTSSNGALVYQRAARQLSRLVWLDRRGASIGEVASPGEHVTMRLSPDELRLARMTIDPDTRSSDIWVDDLTRNVPTRLTSTPDASFPVWSPGGDRIAFCRPVNAPPFLHVKSLAGGEAQVLLPSNGTLQCPADWSRDGRFLLFAERSPETGWDIWSHPMQGDGAPVPLLRSSASESHASLSPDGRWIAYDSSESGEREVYVQPFDRPGEKRRVSTEGGWVARWNREGDELFYFSRDNELMAVPVKLEPDLELGIPAALFSFTPGASAIAEYDVNADGSRFLVNVAVPSSDAAPTVVLDWPAGLGEER